MIKSILEKSFPQKISNSSFSNLIEIKPGNYMMLSKNGMKRILEKAPGLVLGQRVKDDNHCVVLVDEDVILIPNNEV
jgi:hypothetical protein